MPNSGARRKRLRRSAPWRRALLGMQPQLRQRPPTWSRSMTTALRPSWAARMAATWPPGPAPMMATSYSGMGAVRVDEGQVGGLCLAASVVGAADKRARLDVAEAEAAAGLAERGVLVGVPVADDGQGLGVGPQVLADGEEVAAGGAQVGHHGLDLVEGLAEADHDARLRRHAWV